MKRRGEEAVKAKKVLHKKRKKQGTGKIDEWCKAGSSMEEIEEEDKLFKVSSKTARTPRKVLEESRLLKGLLEFKKLRDEIKEDREEIRRRIKKVKRRI